MVSTNVDERAKRIIIGVIKTLFPDAKIYLFGSRARKDHQESSDIDIAIDAGKKLERVDVGEARDMLNASNIPRKIDVLDLNGIDNQMRERIKKEMILWKD